MSSDKSRSVTLVIEPMALSRGERWMRHGFTVVYVLASVYFWSLEETRENAFYAGWAGAYAIERIIADSTSAIRRWWSPGP